MEHQIEASLSTDSDGFVSQECPTCRKPFKVVFGEGSGQPIQHCPYCRHAGHDCWWTPEQAKYLEGVVAEQVVNPMLDDFTRNMRRLNRPGSSLRFDVKHNRSTPSPRPVEAESDMVIATFDCCKERIKHNDSQRSLYCIICGKPLDVS